MVNWPDNHTFAVAISHDVDRLSKKWQFFFYIFQGLFQGNFEQIKSHIHSFVALTKGDDPYWNFERIISLEKSLEVKSTFFFLNEKGHVQWYIPKSFILFSGRYNVNDNRIKKIINKLDAEGWEIGLHGSYFSYRDKNLLRYEKEQLESILKKQVIGSRQHYLNLNIPETWQIQAEIGLIYDSSLGFSKKTGIKWQATHPFYPRNPFTGEIIPILQIPMTIMDAPLMQSNDPWEVSLNLIEQFEQTHGVLTLNWHQRVFNTWEYKSWQNMYSKIIQECQQRGAWIAPLGKIADWWISHNSEI